MHFSKAKLLSALCWLKWLKHSTDPCVSSWRIMLSSQYSLFLIALWGVPNPFLWTPHYLSQSTEQFAISKLFLVSRLHNLKNHVLYQGLLRLYSPKGCGWKHWRELHGVVTKVNRPLASSGRKERLPFPQGLQAKLTKHKENNALGQTSAVPGLSKNHCWPTDLQDAGKDMQRQDWMEISEL